MVLAKDARKTRLKWHSLGEECHNPIWMSVYIIHLQVNHTHFIPPSLLSPIDELLIRLFRSLSCPVTARDLAPTIMAPKTLNFITGNKNKLTEVKAILGSTVDLQSQALDLVEIQGTIEDISRDKCLRAAEAVSVLPLIPRHVFGQTLTDS